MKIPKAIQEPSGMWYIRLRIKNEAGDVMTYAVRERTEKKAIDKALAVKAGLKAETVEAKTRTGEKTLRKAVDEYIARRSVQTRDGGLRSPETIRGYRIIQKYRFQGVMDKPMGEIKNWEAVLAEEARICSPKTVSNAWGLIKSVYKENGLPAPNVIDRPTRKRTDGDIKWLEYTEIPMFLEAARGNPWEIGMLLALHSLRSSEIFGLTWERVDLAHGLIDVRGALVRDEHNQFVRKSENKTEQSARTVIIVIPRLRELLDGVEDKTGAVMRCRPNTLYRNVNKVCREAGLMEVGVHGLRHTFASLCYHLGVPELETVRRGGWASSKIVHEIYTHLAARDVQTIDRRLAAFYKNGK